MVLSLFENGGDKGMTILLLFRGVPRASPTTVTFELEVEITRRKYPGPCIAVLKYRCVISKIDGLLPE
jgi:hypothetical protein